MTTPQQPSIVPNVPTKILAIMGSVVGFLSPLMFILSGVSGSGLFLSFMGMLVAFMLFVAAILYDAQNRKYNKAVEEYAAQIDNDAYLVNIRPLYINFIVIILALTVCLTPIIYFGVAALAFTSGALPLMGR